MFLAVSCGEVATNSKVKGDQRFWDLTLPCTSNPSIFQGFLVFSRVFLGLSNRVFLDFCPFTLKFF